MSLPALSESIALIVARAAPLLSAIRVGPNRHITGLICQGDLVVTSDQALPALDRYTVVLPNGAVASGSPWVRDASRNLAVLHLDTSHPVDNPEIATILSGGMVVIVGADADASPTVRLTVVHRLLRTADGPAPVLDMSRDRIDPGGLVLDAEGRLVGLTELGPGGEAMAIPSAVIGHMLAANQAPASAAPLRISAPEPNGRGWLGVALQPITVPEALVARTGQESGRMVVSLIKGGPAELAGMRIGDVLLALNGISASGPQALRAFLGSERIGSVVEVKLLRDGNVLTTHMTVAMRPG